MLCLGVVTHGTQLTSPQLQSAWGRRMSYCEVYVAIRQRQQQQRDHQRVTRLARRLNEVPNTGQATRSFCRVDHPR